MGQEAAHGGEQCQEREGVQEERCDWLNECPGEEVSSLYSQWPVAGPAGALGAPLAPVQEPAGVGGEHTRGLDPVPTRGWTLGIMFNHNCYLGRSIMGGIAPGLL